MKGKSSRCLFFHQEKEILTLEHGGNVMSTATAKSLAWINEVLKKKLEVKTEMLGPAGEGECRDQIQFLNRILSWESCGIRYEADPRQAEIIASQLGLSRSSNSASANSCSA